MHSRRLDATQVTVSALITHLIPLGESNEVWGGLFKNRNCVLRYYATRNIQHSVSAMANSRLVLGKNQNIQTMLLVFSTFLFLA